MESIPVQVEILASEPSYNIRSEIGWPRSESEVGTYQQKAVMLEPFGDMLKARVILMYFFGAFNSTCALKVFPIGQRSTLLP